MTSKIQTNDQGDLLCPTCGNNYMHAGPVTVFNRKEDAEQGMRTDVHKRLSLTITNLTGNPSSRRGAVQIRFFCENCHSQSMLSFVQHKGNTLVSFDAIDCAFSVDAFDEGSA